MTIGNAKPRLRRATCISRICGGSTEGSKPASPLLDPGRLTLKHKLAREYFDAGIEYGGLCRFYLHALGARRVIDEGTNGSGLGVSEAKTRWLAREVERLETELRKNPIGFAALRTIAIFEGEIAQESEPPAVLVLTELAGLLRKVGR